MASSTCTWLFLIRRNVNYTNLHIEKSLKLEFPEFFSDNIPKVTMIEVLINNKQITMISCYRSQKTNPIDLLKLYIPLINSEDVIFGGDFNLKHQILGDSDQNSQSIEFIDFLDETDYFIIKPPGSTHYKGGHLDFFFTSYSIKNNIYNHKIFDNLNC